MHRAILVTFLATVAWAAGDEAFNGRWNIQPSGMRRAWWLEIEGAGTPALKGKFVGAPGGQLDEIPRISIRRGELRFEFERKWRIGDRVRQARGVWTARIQDGKLAGLFRLPGQPPVSWVGERAPVINEKDDGTWRETQPIELFNGRDLTGWVPLGRPGEVGWTVKDGILVNDPKAPNLMTEAKFWNFLLHVEYRLGPKSNSGIGLRGRYEVQILEDFGRPPSGHSNGAVYSRIPPSVNASKPAGEWQTFDIRLVGRMVTVVLNGVKIIDNREIEGLTAIAVDPHEDRPGPILLQGDHGVVEFRKITLTPLVR
ncbi:MAG: DUF1080 domain-containing protein [Bryobacterales bacterium]|nr:DUF1080 domain-containing protein [Bryobacteraceae bacterium]MDW8130862.1 DUF1080 domain-containing protein [Bryobacterales bacterium]